MANEDRPIYINQSRRGVYSNDGTVLYQIVTEVVANSSYTGDTRDSGYLLNLFVQTIVDTEDTTQDTFSNYATLADLDLIPNPPGISQLERGPPGAGTLHSTLNLTAIK